MGEPMLAPENLEKLLLEALPYWISPSKQPEVGKFVGFGLNFGLFSALDTLGSHWGLLEVLKAASIGKIGIGSGVSLDGKTVFIIMRLYSLSWIKTPYFTKEPIDFLIWLKYLTIDTLNMALKYGALCICDLILSKDAQRTILLQGASKTNTPTGLAADVYEQLVLSWYLVIILLC